MFCVSPIHTHSPGGDSDDTHAALPRLDITHTRYAYSYLLQRWTKWMFIWRSSANQRRKKKKKDARRRRVKKHLKWRESRAPSLRDDCVCSDGGGARTASNLHHPPTLLLLPPPARLLFPRFSFFCQIQQRHFSSLHFSSCIIIPMPVRLAARKRLE